MHGSAIALAIFSFRNSNLKEGLEEKKKKKDNGFKAWQYHCQSANYASALNICLYMFMCMQYIYQSTSHLIFSYNFLVVTLITKIRHLNILQKRLDEQGSSWFPTSVISGHLAELYLLTLQAPIFPFVCPRGCKVYLIFKISNSPPVLLPFLYLYTTFLGPMRKFFMYVIQ